MENSVDQQDAGRALMEEMLADPNHGYKAPQFGDVIDGTIMRVDRDELLVDIGSKSEGVITAREFSSLTDDEKSQLTVGDQILVFVTQPENSDGIIGLSVDRARQEKSWRILQEQYDDGAILDAEVVNYNKGGLLVNLDGVRGFVPASQVTAITTGDEIQKQAQMAALAGTSLRLKIIEINRNRNRLILSERQALQEKRDAMKEKLIEELTEGEVRNGKVSSICDFGAFVDVGGADGLVHLSELSWSRVRHPSEVLDIGQEIDVYVLGINAEERKIALSIKRTQPEPWSWVATKYEVNQLVIGTVTQLANFGAFARIEDGIEGLVHVSELAEARVGHPKQLVNEGQELLLRIIRIDPARRRMGLSLRRALEATDEEVEAALGERGVELQHELLKLKIQPDPSDEYEFDEIRHQTSPSSESEDEVEVIEETVTEAVDEIETVVETEDGVEVIEETVTETVDEIETVVETEDGVEVIEETVTETVDEIETVVETEDGVEVIKETITETVDEIEEVVETEDGVEVIEETVTETVDEIEEVIETEDGVEVIEETITDTVDEIEVASSVDGDSEEVVEDVVIEEDTTKALTIEDSDDNDAGEPEETAK